MRSSHVRNAPTSSKTSMAAQRTHAAAATTNKSAQIFQQMCVGSGLTLATGFRPGLTCFLSLGSPLVCSVCCCFLLTSAAMSTKLCGFMFFSRHPHARAAFPLLRAARFAAPCTCLDNARMYLFDLALAEHALCPHDLLLMPLSPTTAWR